MHVPQFIDAMKATRMVRTFRSVDSIPAMVVGHFGRWGVERRHGKWKRSSSTATTRRALSDHIGLRNESGSLVVNPYLNDHKVQ
jgi:hypothetical protein